MWSHHAKMAEILHSSRISDAGLNFLLRWGQFGSQVQEGFECLDKATCTARPGVKHFETCALGTDCAQRMLVKATVAWSLCQVRLCQHHLEVLQKHAATAPVTVSLAFSKEVSKVSRPMATSLVCVLQHGWQLWSKTKRCKILAALRKTSLTRVGTTTGCDLLRTGLNCWKTVENTVCRFQD